MRSAIGGTHPAERGWAVPIEKNVEKPLLSGKGEALSYCVISNATAVPNQQADRWYAAYTRPSHEKVVAEHLRLRGISHFLPLYRTVRRWQNRCRVQLQLPLFPGYVFVRMDAAARVRVLQVPSVLSIVGRGRIPEPLADSEIDTLQRGLEQCHAQPYPYIDVGERARIRSGPLAGMVGIVVRKKNSLRVILTVEQIMKSVAVEVDGFDLEPVSLRTH